MKYRIYDRVFVKNKGEAIIDHRVTHDKESFGVFFPETGPSRWHKASDFMLIDNYCPELLDQWEESYRVRSAERERAYQETRENYRNLSFNLASWTQPWEFPEGDDQ